VLKVAEIPLFLKELVLKELVPAGAGGRAFRLDLPGIAQVVEARRGDLYN